MAKNNKNKNKTTKTKTKKKDSTFWMSVFIMAIMVLSIGGFALMSGGKTSSKSDSKYQSDIPFQQFNQNGQIFWGAIINQEQFVFENIDGYDEDLVEAQLAKQIKNQTFIDVYTDNGFQSSDAMFLIEKSLKALKIKYAKVTTPECNPNTLVLTNNETYEGNCMKFIASNTDAAHKADILTYHLIK